MKNSNTNDPNPTAADELLDEAEQLIWALLDEQLDHADATRLSQMIQDNLAVRTRYLDCVQLHVDLHEHFGRQSAKKPSGVVLTNLSPGFPELPGVPRVAE